MRMIVRTTRIVPAAIRKTHLKSFFSAPPVRAKRG